MTFLLQTSQTVRILYAKYLEKQIELADIKIKLMKRKLQEMELEIKRGTFRKLDLEIQKLEREVSNSVHTVTITAIQCFNHCCFCSLYSRIQVTKRNDWQINLRWCRH